MTIAPDNSKLTRSDFRVHADLEDRKPHWLIEHPYGWTLLATALRRKQPESACPLYAHDSEFVCDLERVIDDLELREWVRPQDFREHVRAVGSIFRCFWALEMGYPIPASVRVAICPPDARGDV